MASTASTLGVQSTGSITDNDFKRYRSLADGSVAVQATTAADYGYQPISTATTTTVKSGAGQLAGIVLLGGTLGNITIYDNTAASGTVIAPAFTPAALTGCYFIPFNVSFSTGLTIVTAAATVMTVVYR